MDPEMLGLSGGEFFLVAYLALALISARYWPRLGGELARRLLGAQDAVRSSSRPPLT